MKRVTLITIALLICFFVNTNAQGLYVRGGVGYSFQLAGQTIDGNGNVLNGSLNNFKNVFGADSFALYNVKKASFSSGFHGYVSVGYMLNNHIGVELGGDFGLSLTKYTGTYDNVPGVDTIPSTITQKQYAQIPIVLMPMLVLQTGGTRVNLYARGGFALPIKSKMIQDILYVNEPGTGAQIPIDATWEIKNRFSLGFTGAMGIKYNISSRSSIFGEVSILSLSLYPKEADLTNVTVNGQGGYLQYITPRQINYSNKATVMSNNNLTPTVSIDQPEYSVPFSNVGINVGYSYTLFSNRHRNIPEERSENQHTKKRSYYR